MRLEDKKWIDNASYEQLLSRWRFSPVGDSIFLDDTGEYYATVMRQKREEDNAEHVNVSKSIGWEQ